MDAGILPEVYRKVLTAKKYLATGKAASVKEAAQLAGISRSAYYKYKDAIFEYGTSASDEVATVKARLQDSAGVLSSFIGAISRVGGNVLSVNQSLPQDGAADVTVTEDEVKDIQKAIRSFMIAAENGNDYAEYQLGKIYLYGKDIPRDTDKAMYYLHLAAEHGNQYAAQLIHSIRVNGNWTAALASLRLLGHITRIIKSRIEDKRKGSGTDRKLLRKIEEKKQAQGLKQ